MANITLDNMIMSPWVSVQQASINWDKISVTSDINNSLGGSASSRLGTSDTNNHRMDYTRW